MSYHFNAIEAKWQKFWAENQTFKASNSSEKEKYYVLDMFPYPSGAGLHVGHPLGYIASDIYSRYKRHKGFNVLHPQGYDSFGLPAEQYAIQTGQHPANTTQINIEGCLDEKGNILKKYVNPDGSIQDGALIEKGKKTTIHDTNYRDNIIKGYRRQLDKMGFSFDWSREVRTSDPQYYKWTQWIFIELFNSWYDMAADKARPVSELEEIFATEGNTEVNAACDDDVTDFTAEEWNAFSSEEKQEILLQYRLTYLAETEVNWCPQLGTVLANDEIVNGVSERGGYPVVRKKMTQWSMRISAYAERLRADLDKIDWSESLKESQRNWIGKSVGAMVKFPILSFPEGEGKAARGEAQKAPPSGDGGISVFTTRPDTIFGVTFMTLAPEHELVSKITTKGQRTAVEAYVKASAKRSERERMADVKTISGVFTGAYAEHPFTKEPIPIWIGDYVLAGYGTGAVMAVPCGDQRDYDFAKHFNIPIKNIFANADISEEAFSGKEGTVIANSDFLSGLEYKEALPRVIEELEKTGYGKGKTNYRLRDAVFSRQRYWGEPFPVYYKNGLPYTIPEDCLPLKLPEVEKYLPTEEGEPPLGRATKWHWDENNKKVVAVKEDEKPPSGVWGLELNTMPGWAGSSWYLFRYMDPHNEEQFVSKEAREYWENVDLYIGGSEHATGHLLYSRFWTKFLYDRGFVTVEEPFKKLINQGMILGESAFLWIVEPIIMYQNEKMKMAKLCPLYINEKFILSHSLIEKEDTWPLFGELAFENHKLQNKFKALLLNKYKDKGIAEYEDSYVREFIEDIENVKINSVHAFKRRLDINLLKRGSNELDLENLLLDKRYKIFSEFEFIDDNGKITASREVEKMSKSKYNVVNPDEICENYGADTLRMYEMFLGPLEQAKPWNTAGITGVHSFLKKLWKLYHNEEKFEISDEPASKDSLKTLHKTIKKVTEDIEVFSFNTSVSTFMICVNELTAQKCNQREVLEPLAILIAPYAPHIAEELWEKLGHSQSITTAEYPVYVEKFMIESSKEYPISFNGKMRFTLELPLDLSKEEIEKAVMENEKTQKQLEGRAPKKIIVVPGKIVNIVG